MASMSSSDFGEVDNGLQCQTWNIPLTQSADFNCDHYPLNIKSLEVLTVKLSGKTNKIPGSQTDNVLSLAWRETYWQVLLVKHTVDIVKRLVSTSPSLTLTDRVLKEVVRVRSIHSTVMCKNRGEGSTSTPNPPLIKQMVVEAFSAEVRWGKKCIYARVCF